jgi:hypothetical protein
MTSDRPGRARRHEHQRRPERGPVLETARLLGLQLLAVVGIATLIVVIVALVGPDDRTSTSTAADSSSSPTTATSPASTRSSTPGSSGASSSSSAPATTTSSTSEPIATATPDSALAKVDVLNQSAPGGSAQKVADQLQRSGWTIGRVSDFHGNISTTTVYWLTPDRRREARQIAQNLGGVRVGQGFATLVGGRITVVLVDKL